MTDQAEVVLRSTVVAGVLWGKLWFVWSSGSMLTAALLVVGGGSSSSTGRILLALLLAPFATIPAYARAKVVLAPDVVTIRNPLSRARRVPVDEVVRVEPATALYSVMSAMSRIGVACFVTATGERVRALLTGGGSPREADRNYEALVAWSDRVGIPLMLRRDQLGVDPVQDRV